VKEPKYLGI